MADIGVGSGIALGAIIGDKLGDRVNADQNAYYGRVARQQALQSRAAQLAKLSDFKIDGKYLPVFGNAIAQGQADVINHYDQLLRTNPYNAKNIIQPEWNQFLANKRLLDLSNEQAIKYNALDPSKSQQEAEVVRTLQSPTTTFADLAALGKKFGTKGITGDANGTFNYNETPVADVQAKFNPDDFNSTEERSPNQYIIDPTTGQKTYPAAGQYVAKTTKAINPTAIAREIAVNMHPGNVLGIAYGADDATKADNAKLNDFVQSEIGKKVTAQTPTPQISYAIKNENIAGIKQAETQPVMTTNHIETTPLLDNGKGDWTHPTTGHTTWNHYITLPTSKKADINASQATIDADTGSPYTGGAATGIIRSIGTKPFYDAEGKNVVSVVPYAKMQALNTSTINNYVTPQNQKLADLQSYEKAWKALNITGTAIPPDKQDDFNEKQEEFRHDLLIQYGLPKTIKAYSNVEVPLHEVVGAVGQKAYDQMNAAALQENAALGKGKSAAASQEKSTGTKPIKWAK